MGRLLYPGEIGNNGNTKFWEVNRVHYGLCESIEYSGRDRSGVVEAFRSSVDRVRKRKEGGGSKDVSVPASGELPSFTPQCKPNRRQPRSQGFLLHGFRSRAK